MCFCFYNYDADINSVMSTSRTICASPCLTISAANSNVKPSSLQVIVSPSMPVPEGVPITNSSLQFKVPPSIQAPEGASITGIVIPSALGGILVFISILVAVTIFIVLRAKWQKKKMIELLEQDFRR